MIPCPALKILSKLASAAYLSVVCRPALFAETLLTADAVWWLWEVLKVPKSALEDLGKLSKWAKLAFTDPALPPVTEQTENLKLLDFSQYPLIKIIWSFLPKLSVL